MTLVKIDGFRNVEHALTAAAAGADFVGMIFAESRRKVGIDDAREIVQALGGSITHQEMASPPSLFRGRGEGLTQWYTHGAEALSRLLEKKRPLTVGVFANNDPEEINEIADEVGLDLIQLSGGEPWSACLMANRQVIKVIHVAPGDDANLVLGRLETGGAAAVLLDRGGTGLAGGSGQSFDWNVAAELGKQMPFWLAGGLNPGNVAEAIRIARPWCVDVSSGTETDGVKDPEKIRAFVKAAKGAL